MRMNHLSWDKMLHGLKKETQHLKNKKMLIIEICDLSYHHTLNDFEFQGNTKKKNACLRLRFDLDCDIFHNLHVYRWLIICILVIRM